jgi:molybdopterin-guanine dinucleotide biosynthesis protein A
MGQNKAQMVFHGQPLVRRVVERFANLEDEILVIANQPEAFEFLGVRLETDILPGKGALGGLYTGLIFATYPIVAVVACDMPFASPELVRAMLEMLESGDLDVVAPSTENGIEPLHAVYRRETCLPAVKLAIDQNRLRMISWFDQVRTRILAPGEISPYDTQGRAFLNVNHPEDWQAAERLAQEED